MRKTIKKSLPILLAIIMVMSALSMVSFASATTNNTIPSQPIGGGVISIKAGTYPVYSSPKTDEAYIIGYTSGGTNNAYSLSTYFAPDGTYFYADCYINNGDMVRGYINGDNVTGNTGWTCDFRTICGSATITNSTTVRYGISTSHGVSDFTLASGTNVDILYKVQGASGASYYAFIKFINPNNGKVGYGYVDINNLNNMNIWSNIKNMDSQPTTGTGYQAKIKSSSTNSTFPVYSNPKLDEGVIMFNIPQNADIRILSYAMPTAFSTPIILIDYVGTDGKGYRGYIQKENVVFDGFIHGVMPDYDPLTVKGTGTIRNSSVVWHGQNEDYFASTSYTIPANTSVELLYYVQGIFDTQFAYIRYKVPGTSNSYGYGYMDINNISDVTIWANIMDFERQPVSMFPATTKSIPNSSKTFTLYSSPRLDEAISLGTVPQGANINLISYTTPAYSSAQFILVDYLGADGKGYRGYMEKENIVWDGFTIGQMPVNDPLTVKGTGIIKNSSVVWHGQNENYFASTSYSLAPNTAIEIIYYVPGVFETQFAYIRYLVPGTASCYGYGYMAITNITNVVAS